MDGSRPRYGSRKVFFQRVWERLHPDGFSEEPQLLSESNSAEYTDDHGSDSVSHITPNLLEEESVGEPGLALQEKKRSSSSTGNLPPNKRFKVTSPHHGLRAD
jgi:hypothetical protein